MGLIIDLFAGGGGASEGIRQALGRSPDYGVNHDAEALAMHERNHPETTHLREDVFAVNPGTLCAGRPVDLLWASPDCTHFSKAKGSRPDRPRSARRRSLATVILWWAKQVRPALICMENVEEFKTWGPLGLDGQPVKEKAGTSFKRWISALRNMGYSVECRELIAADYGTPTTRKRLFIVARCDGRTIEWPEPTHAKKATGGNLIESPRERWRAAAECINWNLPCPSIFERKRPLAENTLKRIAAGLRKFVFGKAEPFIVMCNHSGEQFRGQSLVEPLGVVTCSRDARGVVVPALVGVGGRAGDSPPCGADEPVRTVTGKADRALMTPTLVAIDNKSSQSGSSDVAEPLRTTTTENRHAMAAAFIEKFHGTSTGADIRQPMPNIEAGGGHIAEVRAFLITYYGTGTGQSANDPMRTITTKDRLGLVTIAGQDYQIVDIGLRMLTPRELATAQGFSPDYWLPPTQSAAVRMIGNSVAPPVARAIVQANFPTIQRSEIAA